MNIKTTKYPSRRKRQGWAYFTAYYPASAVEALKQFAKQWHKDNKHLWKETPFIDEVNKD